MQPTPHAQLSDKHHANHSAIPQANQTAGYETFEHLITTRPHDIRTVLISDLHLSEDEPALVQAFLALLDDLMALPNLKKLFILGDWFELWIGDDAYLELSDAQKQTHWLTPMISALKTLRVRGCEILVMHGNRDFLMRQPFCNTFAGEMITEPYELIAEPLRIRLEHGDALCADDKSYQRFRRVTRNPLVQWYFLNKPLSKRLNIADKLRQKSTMDNAKKSAAIMDVNAKAVVAAAVGYDVLLHGHTHRPNRHELELPNNPQQSTSLKDTSFIEKKWRYVLGDWRLNEADMHQAKTQTNSTHSSDNTKTTPSSRRHVTAVIAAVLEDRLSDTPKSELRLLEFEFRF